MQDRKALNAKVQVTAWLMTSTMPRASVHVESFFLLPSADYLRYRNRSSSRVSLAPSASPPLVPFECATGQLHREWRQRCTSRSLRWGQLLRAPECVP